MKREDGYYWVKKSGVWSVAFFSIIENGWRYYFFIDKLLQDDFFEEINENQIIRKK